MGDRIDELKGNVKAGVGRVTHDEKLEASGRAEAAAAKGRREIKGVGNELAGTVKEKAGEAMGDRSLQGEGAADRLKGKAQQAG